MQPIVSIRDLSSRLDMPAARLREIANDIKPHYTTWQLWNKEKTKVRHLMVPRRELKELQRRIRNNILAPIKLGEAVHGGVRGRSPRSNATQHLGQPCVANLDVKEFFPTVRHYIVYRMFRHDLGFGRDVARLLTRLTTLKSELPQGAPTSTAVANVLLTLPADGPISVEAERIDVRYTRFVDDITFSGSNPRPLINIVGRILSQRRLRMYRKKAKWHSKPKLKITPRSRPQRVTGLIVNSKTGPSVSRQYRDNVRAAIFDLHRTTDEGVLRAAVSSIRGRIAHVRQFNPGAAKRLQRYLESTLARE
jgi:RNA-directed DNA polymerase